MKYCILTGASAPTFAEIKPWSTTLLLFVMATPLLLAIFARKKISRHLMLFFAVSIFAASAELWWAFARQPQFATTLALRQMSNDASAAAELRSFDAVNNYIHFAAETVIVIAAISGLVKYGSALWSWFQKKRATAVLNIVAVAIVTFLSGCMKPFDKPEYVEIDTSETGFLIPLEGDGTQQARFQSEDYLKQKKVATKRVQIVHRWSQEGRLEHVGRWIPSVRLVKVNRSPITREWTTEQAAVGVARQNDKAIWVESGDSVGFSMGFNCTAFIAEEDAAKFLYWYPSGSLADVMDHEIRGRIQQTAAEIAGKYPLNILRTRKQEIVDAVKNDVTNFFTARGVTVTTIGMFGGMTYENPEIQKSIDGTFIAQQLRVVAEAKYEAQKKENERIELEAQAVAEKARREASGLADAKKIAADAEAESIRKVTQALNDVQNPALYQIKALEVEKARVEKWDGRYPTWYLGASDSQPNLLLQVPTQLNSATK